MKKVIVTILILLFTPFLTKAESLTFSITPPLIKNNIDPGSVWPSMVKIANNNAQDIDIYVDVMDFESGSTAGTVKFLAESNDPEADNYLLSRWINVSSKPFNIPGDGSREIPFIVDIPEDASPGGHYAAIVVGTKPKENKKEGSAMSISTMISSLIFLNVNGEIVEKGSIREFSTSRNFYKKPDVDFNVVFENTGNVHIQPQGEIRVYNVFNKDKGEVIINQGTEFGNVLPDGKRAWNFNWQGEEGILEMGRYKAELILSYGANDRKTDNMYLNFWIIDFKVIAYVVGPFLLFLILIFIFVKYSIRKAIKESKRVAGYIEPRSGEIKKRKVKHIVNLKEED